MNERQMTNDRQVTSDERRVTSSTAPKPSAVSPHPRRQRWWIGICLLLMATFTIHAQAAATLFFTDGDGIPITGTVRVLCFETAESTPATLTLSVTDGEPDDPAAVPENCNGVAAMWQRHSQPSGKDGHGPAYVTYTTSWAPESGTDGLQDASNKIIISDENPLTLFNIVVSLAWEPMPGSKTADIDEIAEAMALASADLYDWTEGRMAFGQVEIFTNGERWDIADMRFAAANDFRPKAFVGGIVEDTLPYTAPSAPTIRTANKPHPEPTFVFPGLTPSVIFATPTLPFFITSTPSPTPIPTATPMPMGATFVNGNAYFGRQWNGNTSSSGSWAAPNGTRTLIHEWAHYALFLYDEYQLGYCICHDLAQVGRDPAACMAQSEDIVGSTMAYQYTSSEFWHPDTHIVQPFQCENTQQAFIHGDSDWETLARWDDIQGLGLPFDPLPYPAILQPGPDWSADLSRHLYDINVNATGANAEEPNLKFVTSDVPMRDNWDTLQSQVYLLQGAPDNPDRIIPQGRLLSQPADIESGVIQLLGYDSGRDFLHVVAEHYSPVITQTGRLVFPEKMGDGAGLGDGDTLPTVPNKWEYTLETRYRLRDYRAAEMQVVLKSEQDLSGFPPSAQICSQDPGIGCLLLEEMTWDGALDVWKIVFDADKIGLEEIPRYAVVRVMLEDPDALPPGEIIRWVQMAGGEGAGYIDALAPLADGKVQVHIDRNQASEDFPDCGVLSYMPATNYDALVMDEIATGTSLQFPPLRFIDQPLDISLTVPGPEGCPQPVPCQNEPMPRDPETGQFTPVMVTLYYDQEDIDQLGIDESQLRVAHYLGGKEGVWLDVENPITDNYPSTDIIRRDENLNTISFQMYEDGIYGIVVGVDDVVPLAVEAQSTADTPSPTSTPTLILFSALLLSGAILLIGHKKNT